MISELDQLTYLGGLSQNKTRDVLCLICLALTSSLWFQGASSAATNDAAREHCESCEDTISFLPRSSSPTLDQWWAVVRVVVSFADLWWRLLRCTHSRFHLSVAKLSFSSSSRVASPCCDKVVGPRVAGFVSLPLVKGGRSMSPARNALFFWTASALVPVFGQSRPSARRQGNVARSLHESTSPWICESRRSRQAPGR